MKTPPSSLRHSASVAALTAAILASLSALNAAGTFTWTGAGTTSAWSNTSNWNGAITSDNQTDLIFDSTTRTLATSGNGSFLGGNRIARSLTYTANINAGVATSFNFFNSTTPETLTMSAATGNASITVNAGATGGITLGQASGVGSNVGNLVLASNLDIIHNGSGQLTVNTAVTGAGFGVNKSGTGTILFSSASSYTGANAITGGTFLVNTFANGGSNSGLGASSNAATNLIIDGGTLKFGSSAASSSTDRLFSIGANGGTLDASGGAGFIVNFTNTGSMGFNGSTAARTLTLTGTNTGANTLAAVIGDNTGATSLTKTGAGTWVLSGANTYTGATTINAGTLALGASNTLAAGTAITLGGGKLNLGGFSQAAFTNALTMTAASTIDFGAHVSGLTLTFADSSAATWTGSLSLLNFTVGTDNLSFTSVSGLSVGQLSQITLAGYTATGLDSSGNVQFTVSAVPEPGTYALFGGLAAIAVAGLRRRRAA